MTQENHNILALHLGPRTDGSSYRLLRHFQDGVLAAGGTIDVMSVAGGVIEGCRGCGVCYTTGECVIVDDMDEFYSAIESAYRVVVATPVYFYGVPALGKALIDRLQVFWSRIYKLGVKRTFPAEPKGFVMSVGATKGKDLFTPIKLCAKYMFDSIGFPKSFPFKGYRLVESPKDWPSEALAEMESYGRDFVAGSIGKSLGVEMV
jgi:multimeric flavodoxin WrbA